MILTTILELFDRLNPSLRHHPLLTPDQDQVSMSIYNGFSFGYFSSPLFIFSIDLIYQICVDGDRYCFEGDMKTSAEEYMELYPNII